jgi:GNAT superfamily N-acetyltransferase
LSDIPAVVERAAGVYRWGTGRDDFDKSVSAGNWISLLETGNGAVFLVEDSGVSVGFICGYKTHNIDTGKWTAQVWHWYCDPPARGHGIDLLRRFEAWAKEAGCESVSLGCMAQLWSKGHEKIFDRLGYKLDGLSFIKER